MSYCPRPVFVDPRLGERVGRRAAQAIGMAEAVRRGEGGGAFSARSVSPVTCHMWLQPLQMR